MKPWAKGYIEYKEHEIARVLREGSFQSANLPAGYGFRLDERIIEYPWLFSRLPTGAGRLLDAGSTLNFEYLLDQPVLRNKKIDICTLAPEPRCFWRKGISYLYEDLRQLPYSDGLFDWIVCLSTIEHVGMDNAFYTEGRKIAGGRPAAGIPHAKDAGSADESRSKPGDYLIALAELKRVLKPGGTIYLTAPFGKAVDHGWFQVFDYEMVGNLTRYFQPSEAREHYFLYSAQGWHRCEPADASTATIFNIHTAKGYDPDFAAGARAVFCLDMTK
jgi:SAM-dependent methyltransferase